MFELDSSLSMHVEYFQFCRILEQQVHQIQEISICPIWKSGLD